ncbi:MAG: PAS domain-containing protein [Pseudomonadota bacterium]
MNSVLSINQQENAVLHEEVPFGFEEIFFSRTDEKGLIISGNSVFQRVSGYEWDDLQDRPHNMVRHSDMPKAVFWILWDRIKKGSPAGAYVKNRAKDGRYYWVFAIVTPIDGGYLSVRLKPSSPIFDLVKKEYVSLRNLEREDGLKADNSAAKLLSRLQDLGFKDYEAFMSAALSQEMAARNEGIGRKKDACIAHFDTMVELSRKLLDHAKRISAEYQKSAYVPMNLQIQAAKLGSKGAPISKIASNYNEISFEAKDSMALVIEFGEKVADTINEGLFLISTARIQEEIADLFEHESTDDVASHVQEAKYLRMQQSSYAQRAIEGLEKISSRVAQFQQICAGMRKLTLGLGITSMMGKIEISRLNSFESNLGSLISDLDVFQNSIVDSLNEMYHLNNEIKINIDRSISAA